MPQLQWDELGLVEFLSVLPQTEDGAIFHTFELTRGELQMLLTLRQFESVMHLTISYVDTGADLLDLTAYVRGKVEIRRHIATNEPFLCFSDCLIVANRFQYIEIGDPFDSKRYPFGVDMHLLVDPKICCCLTH
jgi:hypothetical protein